MDLDCKICIYLTSSIGCIACLALTWNLTIQLAPGSGFVGQSQEMHVNRIGCMMIIEKCFLFKHEGNIFTSFSQNFHFFNPSFHLFKLVRSLGEQFGNVGQICCCCFFFSSSVGCCSPMCGFDLRRTMVRWMFGRLGEKRLL